MKKIMIDLDDTITIDTYLNIVNKYLKTNYSYEDIKEYWIDNIVPDEKLDKYLNYIYNKINMYDYAKINENAVEIIEKLTKYYDVLICSAYIDHRTIKDSANILPQKHQWLLENLPFIKPENFIFTSRKDVITTEIKIDDKIENLLEKAEVKILVTAYHNKDIPEEELKEKNIIRVNTWNDIAEILLNH